MRRLHEGRGRQARPGQRGDRMTAQTLPQPSQPASAAPPATYGEEQKKPWYQAEFYIGRAVKAEELMNFSRQAASFLKAGVPILDALSVVGEENASKKMQEVLADVQRRLRSGSSFGDAIAQHPKVFPGYYVAVVRASELTGRLDTALEKLSEYLEREVEAKKKVKSALTYPLIVFFLAIAAMIVMAVYVLPKFRSLYGELHAHLPLPTRMLLTFTNIMTNWWWLILLMVAIVVGVGFAIFGGAHGKERRDRTILRLPAVGKLFNL